MPTEQYRAKPYRPAAAVLYTGSDPQTARGIAANLFQTANLSDTAQVTAATQLFRAGLNEVCLMTFCHPNVLPSRLCDSRMQVRSCARPCQGFDARLGSCFMHA